MKTAELVYHKIDGKTYIESESLIQLLAEVHAKSWAYDLAKVIEWVERIRDKKKC